MSAVPAESLPLSVLMARKEVRRAGWSVPSWEALAVLPGDRLAIGPRQKTLVRAVDGVEQYLWSGFRLELFRDAAEAYWFNLTGSRPALYVVCTGGEDGDLEPVRVTADHMESGAAVEAGGAAFPAAIPPEIRAVMERFVAAYYKPEPPRKRRRDDRPGEDGS